MKTPVFTGSGVAIVTPFTEDGRVNFERLTELIEFQLSNGTDAIIICGTTGESSTLHDDEHRACIRHAVEVVAGRAPVIAGTGSNHTDYALELSQYAEQVGADALLLVTPYYNKTTQAGLIAHFGYIAERVSLPIILYNVPSRTGLNILPETYLALSKYKNIVATKEASGNIGQIAATAALCGDELIIYSGNDNEIVPILSLGGKGVISVLANVLPKETHDICAYYLSGELDKSRELQLNLLEFTNNLFIEVNPIPVKTAMNLMGMEVGGFRMPLCEMGEKNVNVLKASMQKLGLL